MEKKFLDLDAIAEIDNHTQELLDEYNLPHTIDDIYEKEGIDIVDLHQHIKENKDPEYIRELTKFIKNYIECFLRDENAVLGVGSPVPTPPTKEPFKERHPKLAKLRNLILAGAVTLTGASAAYAAAPNNTKEKIEDITKQISKGIPEIPVLTHIGLDDRDHDGVLSYKDKYPDTYNFPAQKYAREIGLSDEIVNKLSPLDSGYEIVYYDHWTMAERQPELDIREKEFIENLKNYNSDIQNKLVKFAQDKRITNRELSIIKNLYNLDPEIQNLILDNVLYNKEPLARPIIALGDLVLNKDPKTQKPIPEYESGFISHLSNFDKSEQEKLIKAFLDDKKISLDELVQTKFLENNKQFFKNEEFKNFDLDGDNMNNYFESLFVLYNPYVKNDRYFIIADTLNSYNVKQFKIKEKIPDENLILLKGKNASALNLRNAIIEVGKKADSNDFVYIFLNGHGGPGYYEKKNLPSGRYVFNGEYKLPTSGDKIGGYILLARSSPDSPNYEEYMREIRIVNGRGESTGYQISGNHYYIIDKWLDRYIKNPKAVCIFVDACYSGSALPSMKDGPCPRVVMTSTSAEFFSSVGFGDIFEAIANAGKEYYGDIVFKVDDLDNNNYISLYEFFMEAYKDAKFKRDRALKKGEYIPDNSPQLSDPYNLSNKIYFGDYEMPN